MPTAGCLSQAEDTTPQRRFSDFISRLLGSRRQARLSCWRAFSPLQGPNYRITSGFFRGRRLVDLLSSLGSKRYPAGVVRSVVRSNFSAVLASFDALLVYSSILSLS